MEDQKMPKATHVGELEIGEILLPCAVLEDGTRVISERGMTKALGGKRGGAHWRRKKELGANLPAFVSAKNLEPFIGTDLRTALIEPILYKTKSGAIANGVNAKSIPAICDVWLKARDASALLPSQEHLAIKADILMRGLAQVGIIALVDEATGYQEVRDRNELNKILEAYIAKELLPWTKRFPDEFYQELFRLLNWQYSPMSAKRPGYVGTLTNQLVYEKLPPRVIDELREINPSVKGRRKHKHHQFLTEDIGNPHLEKHIASVTTLMRISPNYKTFKKYFDKAFPPSMEQIEIFEQEDAAAISSEE